MENVDNTIGAPTGWLEALERSEAQLAAGQVVSGEVVMRELLESITRLEGQQKIRRQTGAD
jgi:hypothetical protein